MFKSLINKLKSMFSKGKTSNLIQYFLVGIVLLIMIVVLCGNFFQTKSANNNLTDADLVSTYVNTLEEKLSNTLSKVDGAGEVSVVITVESGMETVIAKKVITKETTDGKETEETPILVNGKTVILKEMYPNIVGVLIVAQGANKISVLNKIQQATISLLNIELNQIEILTMK